MLAPALRAQTDSTALPSIEMPEASGPVDDLFFGTRAVDLMTVRQLGKKVLAYRISHRFGDFSTGAYNNFGLDGPGSITIALDYGVTSKLSVGFDRSNVGKVYSVYGKYTLLEQQKDNSMPLSLAVYSRANITALRDDQAQANGFNRFDNFSHRFSYITQVMVARNFADRFSLQLSPTWIHYNLVDTREHSNDIFALAAAGHVKLNKRLGLNFEYSRTLNTYLPGSISDQFYDHMGLGFDIVTGGHVFQIVVINSFAINDAMAIPYTVSNPLDGALRLGFNISRNFWL